MTRENERFQLAFDLVNYTGMHLFLTGRAGTGKTTFLHHLKQHTHKTYAVVAPTGVAAINAGGVTLHSFLGIPINCVYVPDDAAPGYRHQENSFAIHDRYSLLQSLRLQGMRQKVLRQLELLIIDEISMVRADTLDMVNAILQHVRRNRQPFGGVQMLFIGDLFQLPPVINREQEALVQQWYKSGHFFEARVMLEARPQFLELNKVYRQRDDQFVTLLNKVRNNLLDGADIDALHERFDPDFEPPAHQGFITLTTHNYLADDINNSTLEALDTDPSVCRAELQGDFPEKSYPAEQKLVLKPGAQVMFIKNDLSPVKRYYNGKIGQVTAIETDEVVVNCPDEEDPIRVSRVEWNHIRYRWDESNKAMQEEVLGSFRQFPLRLAWAVTIHKSQGLTFDRLVIDAGQAFQEGQVYVALSRATSLQGIYLRTAIPRNRIRTNERVVQFYQKERPVEALSLLVQSEKERYVIDRLLGTFDWQEVMVKLMGIKTLLLSVNRFTAEPYQQWLANLQQCLQQASTSAQPWMQDIRQGITQMHDPDGLPALNQLLTAHLPSWLDVISEPIGKCLRQTPRTPVEVDAADTENLEAMVPFLEQAATLLSEQLDRLERLKKGYAESIFFRRHQFVAQPMPKENKPAAPTQAKPDYPADLLQALKQTARAQAREHNIPVYMIAHNTSLELVAAAMPATADELSAIRGFSARKTALYGEAFLETIAAWRNNHPNTKATIPIAEAGASKPAKKTAEKTNTVELTVTLYREGLSPADIATQRGFAQSTIEGHLAKAITLGLITGEGLVEETILNHCERISPTELSIGGPDLLRSVCGISISWGKLRMAAAILERRSKQAV